MKDISMVWDGEHECFRPTPRFVRYANETFVDDEMYRFTIVEERSVETHNHYFAVLHEIWMNLPDELAVQFPTEDIMRYHALVMTGFRKERKFACESRDEARKLAAFLRPQSLEDAYAVISVHENVVVEWRPLSQSRKGMPEKGQFQRSKQAVLDWCSDLIAVKTSEVRESA